MNVHFVVHEAFETPGALVDWVESRGHKASYSHVHAGQPLPADVSGIDLLVVMGGPQSPETTLAECPHFDSAAEQALIVRCTVAGKYVLGICLGSQLIGAALGARVQHSPEKEIGTYPIALTDAGLAHPLIAPFGPVLTVAHWHNDMPGLTADATVLAASEGCPRQIVAFGPKVFGFQCHMELTPVVVAALIANSGPELEAARGRRFVQTPDALLAHDYSAMNRQIFGFLDRLTAPSTAVGTR